LRLHIGEPATAGIYYIPDIETGARLLVVSLLLVLILDTSIDTKSRHLYTRPLIFSSPVLLNNLKR
jgi:hypothetical protein